MKNKLNSKFNNKNFNYGFIAFFVMVVFCVKFGQSAIRELSNFLECLNIRVSSNGIIELVVPMQTIFNVSQYLSIIAFILSITFISVYITVFFHFVVLYEEKYVSSDTFIECKNYIKEKTTYTVNSRYLC